MKLFAPLLVVLMNCSITFGQTRNDCLNTIGDIAKDEKLDTSSPKYKPLDVANRDFIISNGTFGYFYKSQLSAPYGERNYKTTSNRNFKLNPWENVNGLRLVAGFFYNLETEVS